MFPPPVRWTGPASHDSRHAPSANAAAMRTRRHYDAAGAHCGLRGNRHPIRPCGAPKTAAMTNPNPERTLSDTALLIVDVQNDFCPDGALPVPEGDRVVPVINRYIEQVLAAGGPIIASRDWHPPGTRHFRAAGGPWPPHCVQGTGGAAFHARLDLPTRAVIVTKGDNPRDDGYSAFDGRDPSGRPLADVLKERNVQKVLVGGLATDYCVRASTLDALRHGFRAIILLDAMRGIDLKDGDVARAIDEMIRAGARTATLATIGQELEHEVRA